MSSFKFLFFGWLFASQKSGFSGFRCRFIRSLRFGTGYASPYNPCHCLKLKNSKLNLIIIDSYEYLQEIVQSDDEDIFGLHSTILNKYKEKARELNIPIIVLMELPVRNEDEPSIADFRKKIRNGIYRGVYSCFGNYLS